MTRIAPLIRELDDLVPAGAGGRVRITMEQEPSECELTANQIGYLRLGVVLLQAGLVVPGAQPTELAATTCAVDDLVIRASDVRFAAFVTAASLDADTTQPSLLQRIARGVLAIGCGGLLVFLLIALVVGIVAILGLGG